MEVGIDEVTLRIGKQVNKRSIHFVLQALIALFGMYVCFIFSKALVSYGSNDYALSRRN